MVLHSLYVYAQCVSSLSVPLPRHKQCAGAFVSGEQIYCTNAFNWEVGAHRWFSANANLSVLRHQFHPIGADNDESECVFEFPLANDGSERVFEICGQPRSSRQQLNQKPFILLCPDRPQFSRDPVSRSYRACEQVRAALDSPGLHSFLSSMFVLVPSVLFFIS